MPVTARPHLHVTLTVLALSLLPCGAATAEVPADVEETRNQLDGVEVQPARSGDGLYGRLEGDFDLQLELGAEVQHEVAAQGEIELWYFWTFGLSARHTFDLADEAQVQERTALAVELRPLFLPRWSRDLEAGPAFFDLALDSVALGAGAQLPHERGGRAGPFASLSLGLPLLARASGPWLDVSGVYRFPSGSDNGFALLTGLSWNFLFDSGLN